MQGLNPGGGAQGVVKALHHTQSKPMWPKDMMGAKLVAKIEAA
jgi:hypothetical protein